MPVCDRQIEQQRVEQAAEQIAEVNPDPIAEQGARVDVARDQTGRQQREIAGGQFEAKQNENHKTDGEENSADDGRESLRLHHEDERSGEAQERAGKYAADQHVLTESADFFRGKLDGLANEIFRDDVVGHAVGSFGGFFRMNRGCDIGLNQRRPRRKRQLSGMSVRIRHPVRDGGQRVARRPLSTGSLGNRCDLDQPGDDVGQLFVARHGLENFASGDGVGSRAAAGIDGNGIHDFSVDFGLESAEADVRGLVIAASGGTAGPVDGEGRSVRAELFFQRLREADGAALWFRSAPCCSNRCRRRLPGHERKATDEAKNVLRAALRADRQRDRCGHWE